MRDSESVNFIVRVDPDFHKQIRQSAKEHGMTASKWARTIFAERIAEDERSLMMDNRLDAIIKSYRDLNEEGREHLATCARLAASNREMRN